MAIHPRRLALLAAIALLVYTVVAQGSDVKSKAVKVASLTTQEIEEQLQVYTNLYSSTHTLSHADIDHDSNVLSSLTSPPTMLQQTHQRSPPFKKPSPTSSPLPRQQSTPC